MMAIYLRLYLEFFKTGLFAVGGGMATLPFLKEIGEATGWYTYGDLMNMLAVSESTPRPHRHQYGDLCGLYRGRRPRGGDRHPGRVNPLHHRDLDRGGDFEELPG